MRCITEDGIVLAQEVEMACSLFKRMKGLMFRPEMKAGTAMLLKPCPQIHTCFMYFALDVLFLDKNGSVLYIMEDMKPWRLSPIVSRAAQTLEMPAGTLQGRVKKGAKVRFEN